MDKVGADAPNGRRPNVPPLQTNSEVLAAQKAWRLEKRREFELRNKKKLARQALNDHAYAPPPVTHAQHMHAQHMHIQHQPPQHHPPPMASPHPPNKRLKTYNVSVSAGVPVFPDPHTAAQYAPQYARAPDAPFHYQVEFSAVPASQSAVSVPMSAGVSALTVAAPPPIAPAPPPPPPPPPADEHERTLEAQRRWKLKKLRELAEKRAKAAPSKRGRRKGSGAPASVASHASPGFTHAIMPDPRSADGAVVMATAAALQHAQIPASHAIPLGSHQMTYASLPLTHSMPISHSVPMSHALPQQSTAELVAMAHHSLAPYVYAQSHPDQQHLQPVQQQALVADTDQHAQVDHGVHHTQPVEDVGAEHLAQHAQPTEHDLAEHLPPHSQPVEHEQLQQHPQHVEHPVAEHVPQMQPSEHFVSEHDVQHAQTVEHNIAEQVSHAQTAEMHEGTEPTDNTMVHISAQADDGSGPALSAEEAVGLGVSSEAPPGSENIPDTETTAIGTGTDSSRGIGDHNATEQAPAVDSVEGEVETSAVADQTSTIEQPTNSEPGLDIGASGADIGDTTETGSKEKSVADVVGELQMAPLEVTAQGATVHATESHEVATGESATNQVSVDEDQNANGKLVTTDGVPAEQMLEHRPDGVSDAYTATMSAQQGAVNSAPQDHFQMEGGDDIMGSATAWQNLDNINQH